MLAWLETSVPQPATAVTGDPSRTCRIRKPPRISTHLRSNCPRTWPASPMLAGPGPAGNSRRVWDAGRAEDLKTMIDSPARQPDTSGGLPAAVLRRVPGPWTPDPVPNPETELRSDTRGSAPGARGHGRPVARMDRTRIRRPLHRPAGGNPGRRTQGDRAPGPRQGPMVRSLRRR